MKAVVAAFNQEKALVGAFSVIVQLHRLIVYSTNLEHALVGAAVGLLAAEVLGGLLVVLHRLVQVRSLGLEQLGDGLQQKQYNVLRGEASL